MTNSMKSENRLDGASNLRGWKTSIDLILAKNKVLDIVKGKIVKPEFEEGKEKEPQNVAAMEMFKDVDINAMSIIVDSINDHLIPYISHLDSSKKMYDALTNLFSVINIGQVMSLKNELRDMKMNDDDCITSYFVRISQLRDQLQTIEEITSEKELVNIVLNGLPKTWDAFAASMNTRKEYPTFEELWNCCAQEESRINAKESQLYIAEDNKDADGSMDSIRQESQLYIAEDNKDEDGSMDSGRQESQLYIAEDNKDADGSLDSVRRREPIICTPI
jgi:hypothetical protein